MYEKLFLEVYIYENTLNHYLETIPCISLDVCTRCHLDQIESPS